MAKVFIGNVKGKDGYTPYIGANGNWYIGTTDTGVKAEGKNGADGAKGDKGDTGAQGIQGIQGEKGDKGDKGDTGAQGAQGEKGDKGDTGEAYTLTDTDKNTIVNAVIASLNNANGVSF